MRILLNALPAYGPRSGVGHYVSELLRCLSLMGDRGEQVLARPGPWVGRLRRFFHGKGGPPTSRTSSRQRFKRSLAKVLKPLGRSLVRYYMRAVATSGR